jgi:hypothetical protein
MVSDRDRAQPRLADIASPFWFNAEDAARRTR